MTPEEAIAALLQARAADATICPSEAARLMAGAGGDWRTRMDDVHEASGRLVDAGDVVLSWKGRPLARPEGPYRIGRSR
ncbi:DUF3253 domain-containing protein [Aurantiacibacter luteus]|uniref:S-adenosylmethionine tRNA ribosyltransferase n=1 Tax=Aurantiacibacter luteus TaxID=1581420 RepID=A0A0G9MVG3_9SPHN|nr:DUF3253 domain-containing protein [Aurantiacibacter luteus]KLE34752.1 hypothetical protein AAW00_11435 [Aurantiacibacter luteus]